MNFSSRLCLALTSVAFASTPLRASTVKAELKKAEARKIAFAENVHVALLAHIQPKPGKEAQLEKFLVDEQIVAKDEISTVQWFALKFGPKQYGMFDTFANESGRKAHIDGRIPIALGDKGPEMVQGAPDMKPIDLIASKVPVDLPKGGVKKGLLATLEVRPGRDKDAQAFLVSALPWIKLEPKTVHWYAWKMSPTTFGIFDTFADEAGRQAHLDGKIAAAIKARSPDLFIKPPQIEKVDLVAAKP